MKDGTVQRMKANEAAVIMAGAPAALLAEAGESGQKPARFRMELYTGSVFRGHWYWGDVVLDTGGFKPHRADIPAMLNHYDTVGYTTELRAEQPAKIIAEGVLLEGSIEEEPSANRVRRRLAQKHPYQSSGRWEPLRVEKVDKDAVATVNGKAMRGPLTIFRQFTVREASFADLGWDGNTRAVAAKDDKDRTVSVEVIQANAGGEHAMSENQNTPAQAGTEQAPPAAAPAKPKGILATLAEIVGADRAIVLVTAKPEATEIAAFAEDLAGDLKALRTQLGEARTQLTAKDAEIGSLKAQLADSKKAPPVATVAGDAPQPPEGGSVKATGEEAWKKEWEGTPKLQAEFPKVDYYLAEKRHQAQREGK